jgi:hypothetical protein
VLEEEGAGMTFFEAFTDELEKISGTRMVKKGGLIGAGLGGLGGFLGSKMLGFGGVGKTIGTGVGALAGHGLTSLFKTKPRPSAVTRAR